MSNAEEPLPPQNPPPVLTESFNTAHPEKPHPESAPVDNDRVAMGEPGQLPRGSTIGGHEEILYGAPQEIPENMNFFQIDFIFVTLGTSLLCNIVLGVLLITAYNSTPLDFKPAILFLAIYQVLRVCVMSYFWARHGQANPGMVALYKFDMIYCFSFLMVYIGIYLALAKSITPDALVYFVYAHVLLMLIRMCNEPTENAFFMPGGAFAFFESIQLLLIAYKVSQSDGSVNWTWVMLFYYIVALVLLILAFFTTLAFVIVGSMALLSDVFRQMPRAFMWSILTVLFYISWIGLVFYMAVSGFEFLAAANQLGFGSPKGSPDTRIKAVGYIMVVCGILTLIGLILLYGAIKAMILENIRKGRSKEVTLKSFTENLNMDITRVSENFFRPVNPGQAPGGDIETGTPNDAPLNPDEGLCIICQDKKSDVMIKPCGHGGFCTDCMKEYLKDKEDCSLCRTKIDEVYLLVEDPATKKFKARGVIKLKR